MATKAAHKRLTREYASLTANPIEYITAHPSESNILEWHYILTGPANTPYHHGQYWGTLVFPPDYPFAPPAIRMHTPSGRFRPSERLCLSISDFHPKSFNPAWEVSTILLGVLSFMTSEEMTTGIRGGGSTSRTLASGEAEQVQSSNTRGFGAIKAGDGGKRFREQWAEVDEENWKWMEERRVDPQTGKGLAPVQQEQQSACSPETAALRMRATGSNAGLGAVVEGGQAATEAGRGWLGRNWGKVVMATLFAYVIAARLLSDAKA
ncbi:Ubiquitin-conjugating enzyme E2 6 [Friedmanniomyces endolithicus]|nr:Ubiquitin-conjugating enzyme E2 6 [Friedmanniomyces endolithicus]